jgi:hypothetical protein
VSPIIVERRQSATVRGLGASDAPSLPGHLSPGMDRVPLLAASGSHWLGRTSDVAGLAGWGELAEREHGALRVANHG